MSSLIEKAMTIGFVVGVGVAPSRAWPAPGKANAEGEACLRRRAMSYCAFLPATQKPRGQGCEANVELRAAKCVTDGRRDARTFEACLGLPPPSVIPEQSRAQAAYVRQVSLNACGQLPRPTGESDCAAEVEIRLPRCLPPFLFREIDAFAFSRCLGFEIERPPAREVLATCEAAHVLPRLAFAIGRDRPWSTSHLRVVDGRSLHVADAPVVTQKDLTSASLVREGKFSFVELQWTSEAASRIAKATKENVGQWLVMDVDRQTVVAKIESPITGNRGQVSILDARPEDICGPSDPPP